MTQGGVQGATPAFGGDWTREKLRILEEYLDSYTTALKNMSFQLVYVDAFAGTGRIIRDSGPGYETDENDSRSLILGSAGRALRVNDRAFDRLVFVEKDDARYRQLRELCDRHPNRNTQPLRGDANTFLRDLRESEYGNWRGVLFVDPFGVQLEWATVHHIAGLQRLDMWLLFPVGAIGRMLPRFRNPDEVQPGWPDRLDAVFGGDHWRQLYSPSPQQSLFGGEMVEREQGVAGLLSIYKDQLKETFGPRLLRDSCTLTNSKNSPLFEFIFCAGHPNGAAIAKRIARHLIRDISSPYSP
ncbi:MAG: three-Cys-motif partner protein TcmP [Gemmatimonadota bacterium]|nr:three-Cys-motif partner protein TcmP [Gemmatimonadota bacterium]